MEVYLNGVKKSGK